MRKMLWKRNKLFCEINPVFYAISVRKEIIKRHIKNFLSSEKIAKTIQADKLPNLVWESHANMIKRAPGINLTHQLNKAVNIDLASQKINGILIRPGESFSFWQTVEKTSKRKGYKEGRIIQGNKLIAGIGGGLCNLGNTIHLLVLHSPLKVTEFCKHSDALAPDEGKRVPFSAGTSVCYNYLDFKFLNTSDQNVQLSIWCEGETLHAELRSERPFPYRYELIEEDHHFKKEGEKYYQNSTIYRNVIDRETNEVTDKELILTNHSEVMYNYDLIPKELIRE